MAGASTGVATETFNVTATYSALSIQNLVISPTVLVGQIATLTGDVGGLGGSSCNIIVNWGPNQGDEQSYPFPADTTHFSISHYYQDAAGQPFAIAYPVSVTLATSDLLGTVTVLTSTIGLDPAGLINVAINGGRDSDRGPGGQATLSAIALSRGENETYTYTWTVTDDEDIGYSYISSGSSPTFNFDPPNATDDLRRYRDGHGRRRRVGKPGRHGGAVR